MISDPVMVHAINSRIDREQALFNFYRMQRRAGSCPIKATEEMGEYAARLDAAAERVADDRFNRDLAAIRSVMELTR